MKFIHSGKEEHAIVNLDRITSIYFSEGQTKTSFKIIFKTNEDMFIEWKFTDKNIFDTIVTKVKESADISYLA